MKSPSKPVLFGLLFVTCFLIFHRPVPWNFTDSIFERLVMFVMELIMRFTYIYPSRLLYDHPFDQLNYTRLVGNWLCSFLSPESLSDPDILIEDVLFDSVKVRVYVPRRNRSNDGAIVFLHGGAFVVGNVQMFESLTRQLTKNTRMVVVSVDYRLAPEYIFPAGLDDCDKAVAHLLQHAWKIYHINPHRVVVMGDSAGGGLVASLTQRFRSRHDLPPLKAQVMVYPLVQLHDLRTSSYEYYYREMGGTAFLEPRVLAEYYLMYAGIDVKTHRNLVDIVLNNQHISPLDRDFLDQYIDLNMLPSKYRAKRNMTFWKYDEFAARLLSPFLFNPEFAPLVQPDLTGLPQALILTCEHDILRDEGVIYAQRLKEAGVDTTWKHLPTSFHGLLNFHSTLATGNRALNYISDWISDRV